MMTRRNFLPTALFLATALAMLSPGAHAAGSRYAPLLATSAGQDTLRNLALWEDQRVTDDGRIFAYLAEGSPLVRRRALEAIGRMQEPADAAKVIPSLKDKNREVLREAVFALGQIGNREAVPPLLGARTGASPEEVAMIADALGKLGGDDAVQALIELLRDFNASVRGAAALALARTPGEDAAGALLIAVHDPDMSVKWRVVYALGKQPVMGRSCQVLIDCLESEDARVRASAARSLGELKCHAAASQLVHLAADPDLHVAINATCALGKLQAHDAVDVLCGILMTGDSHLARGAAAEALGQIGQKGARDALMQGQLDTSVLVRANCARALAQCLGEGSEMFLDQARKDGSRLVRAAAVESFGEAGITARAHEIEKIATDDKDSMLRAAAVTALGGMKDDAVPPFLPPHLRDPDFTVAVATVDAIGKQAYRVAVPSLVDAYYAPRTEGHVDVQLEIVGVLEKLVAVEAESLLVDALHHEDYRVRDAAVSALKSFGRTPPELPDARATRELSYDRSRRKVLAPPTGIRHAVIETSRGRIEVELFGDDAIQTVATFVNLAKKGFYRGLTIHRVVPDFVIQGGDPRGDGSGDAGFTVPAEVSRLQYAEGYLGIADAGKDTGSCQWFITCSPQPRLSGRYTLFGRVKKGMDVVGKIDRGDTFDVKIID